MASNFTIQHALISGLASRDPNDLILLNLIGAALGSLAKARVNDAIVESRPQTSNVDSCCFSIFAFANQSQNVPNRDKKLLY